MPDSETKTPQAVSQDVSSFYNTYPFPPEPLLDEAPPGYNWRWHWGAVHAFCTGQAPDPGRSVRILDAGCGTGVSTEYLAHLNPQADIVALDISPGALQVAQERCRRSQPCQWGSDRLQFHHLSLYDVDQIPGSFDLINSVGVIHHLGDPLRGLQALAAKLAPGGLMHIFVYSELGRREIQLMQEAIHLLQPDGPNYRRSVEVGRAIFAALPPENRLVKREKERWFLENQRDECFADMYVHPHEVDYSTLTLRSLLEQTDLTFLGFSNPQDWDLTPLLGQNSALLEQAKTLDLWQQYRLREILDPDAITHYEFFLAKPPLTQETWTDDRVLQQAIVSRNPCMHGWPSKDLFNQDYRLMTLTEAEFEFLQACDDPANTSKTIAQYLDESMSQPDSPLSLEIVRHLLNQRLIWLRNPVPG